MSKATGKLRPIRIAVASGKGGTGKTTISVALALSAPGSAILMDCDVEEPNASIFFPDAEDVLESVVTVPVPVVDEAKCTGCGACAKFCRFNSIIVIKKEVTIFTELCHSCGGCALVCPEGAINEEKKPIGRLSEWNKGRLRFIQGEMIVGNAMSPPIIRAVKRRSARYEADPDDSAKLAIIDCPPGTSCPVVTAVRGCDFVLLVTEPTPFGLHDLRLAVATIRKMKIPFGVAINRCDVGDGRVDAYCDEENIPILIRIPNDRRVAEAYSSGGTLLAAGEEYRPLMEKLTGDILSRVAEGALG